MSGQFKELFEPVMLGTLEVKNRIVMCPMGLGWASLTGAVTDRLIDYYTERARAGVGLIIVEGTCVESTLGMMGLVPRTLIDSDRLIAGLSDLVESVHRYGAKIAIQLQHGGARATLEGSKQPVSASAVTVRPGVTARALSIAEIGELEEAYAEAARRACAAGFDAVDINCGGGTLIPQFLSPLTNKRTDSYGGDLPGRMKFISEIVARVQSKVGKDYPIIIDHPADELVEGGITLQESRIIAQRLEELGVAAFKMQSGLIDPRILNWLFPPAAMPRGLQVHYAEETKKVLKQAKVLVGRRIQDPDYANSIIEEGKADLVVLGRPLIADPEVPKKWAEGRLDDVRRCLYCNQCYWHYSRKLSARCTVNAALGKERSFRIVSTEKPKKVVVVGGGPAGMEAARVAALRGHRVTLYEKGDRLGGQLTLACVPPHTEEIKNLIQWLANQVRKAGVRVELGKEATEEILREERPEVVILATGAMPLIPDISGVDKKIVSTAWDVLAGKVETGDKVIVVGGGQVGLETAEYLAETGKKVSVVEPSSEAGFDVEPLTKMLLLERLAKYNVNVLTNTNVARIADNGIVVADGRERKTIEAESVVLALGKTPDKKLEELKKQGAEVYSIGDCVAPRKALHAIHEGYWVATQI